MKFKVGDRVKVVKNESCMNAKDKFIGKEYVIENEQGCDALHGTRYGIGQTYIVYESEIVPIVNTSKILITSDGTTTLARRYEKQSDGYEKLIKSAEAKCAPSDTFSFNTGAGIAFDRLIGGRYSPVDPTQTVTPKTEDKPEPKPEPAKAPVDSVKLYCVKDYKPGIWLTKGKVYDLDLAKNVVTVDNGYGTKYADNLGGEPFVQYFCKLVSRPAKVGEWAVPTGNSHDSKIVLNKPYKVLEINWYGTSIRTADIGHGGILESDEYLVLDGYTEPEPKYYNGKVVCVEAHPDCAYTQGRVYSITDGKFVDDIGRTIPCFDVMNPRTEPIRDLKEWNEFSLSEFIEFKGEA